MILEGAGTENGVEVPSEARKAQVQNTPRGAGRVTSNFTGSTGGNSTEETRNLRADNRSTARAAGLCAGLRGARDQCPLTWPDPRPERPEGPSGGRAPEDSQPVGPHSQAQCGGPGRAALLATPLWLRRPRSPARGGVSPERRHQGRGHLPKTRKSPHGPVTPSPPLRSGHRRTKSCHPAQKDDHLLNVNEGPLLHASQTIYSTQGKPFTPRVSKGRCAGWRLLSAPRSPTRGPFPEPAHPPRPRSAGYSRPGRSRAARAGLRHHGRLLLFLVLLNPREAPCPKQMVDGILKRKNVRTRPLRFCPQTAQCSGSLLGPDLRSDAPSSPADRRTAMGSSGGRFLRPARPPRLRSAPCPRPPWGLSLPPCSPTGPAHCQARVTTPASRPQRASRSSLRRGGLVGRFFHFSNTDPQIRLEIKLIQQKHH